MDNVPQNILNLASSSSESIPMRTNPSYEPARRKEDLDQGKAVEEDRQDASIGARKSTRVIVVALILLLLITLASIVLSVISYSRSEYSQILSQLNRTNSDDIVEVQPTLCNIPSNVLQILTLLDSRITCRNEVQLHCGPGLWWQVASLNMSDPSQQCPSAWREYNTSGVRACGRPFNSTGSCAATVYFTGRQYSRVCGRVIGYQIGSPDAFSVDAIREISLGVDGIRITYGIQRNHIWSYVAGVKEMGDFPPAIATSHCPCSSEQSRPMPPQFIGNNYFCESGNPTDSFDDNHFFSNDPLWDGQQCEGTCCTGTGSSPPWFSVQLPAPTIDVIEVRICLDQGTADEDTPVELIEIYVQ